MKLYKFYFSVIFSVLFSHLSCMEREFSKEKFLRDLFWNADSTGKYIDKLKKYSEERNKNNISIIKNTVKEKILIQEKPIIELFGLWWKKNVCTISYIQGPADEKRQYYLPGCVTSNEVECDDHTPFLELMAIKSLQNGWNIYLNNKKVLLFENKAAFFNTSLY